MSANFYQYMAVNKGVVVLIADKIKNETSDYQTRLPLTKVMTTFDGNSLPSQASTVACRSASDLSGGSILKFES